MIQLTPDPIHTDAVLDCVRSKRAGAVVLFLGTTRQFTEGRETVKLAYEAYHEMAIQMLETLKVEASQKWELQACCLVHRLGTVPLGEASVAVAVSAAHRAEAFAAGAWLIDELKVRVPIWKQEHWADGQTDWVHPSQSIHTEDADRGRGPAC